MEKIAIEKLQKKLNEEYADVGTITISDASQALVMPKEIQFVESIMEFTQALDSDEPIVVAQDSYGYYLIDGYHRLKKHLENRDTAISVIVLEDYELERLDDNLFDFISRLVGKTICALDNYTFSVDGRLFYIKTNEGCGGCGNGWSDLKILPEFISKGIKIQDVRMEPPTGDSEDEDVYDDEYDLYINGKLFARVDAGWGNGYYGGDFDIIKSSF